MIPEFENNVDAPTTELNNNEENINTEDSEILPVIQTKPEEGPAKTKKYEFKIDSIYKSSKEASLIFNSDKVSQFESFIKQYKSKRKCLKSIEDKYERKIDKNVTKSHSFLLKIRDKVINKNSEQKPELQRASQELVLFNGLKQYCKNKA